VAVLGAFLGVESGVCGHGRGIRFQLQFVGLKLNGQRVPHLIVLLCLSFFEEPERDFLFGLLNLFPLSEGRLVGCNLGGASLVHFLREELVFLLVLSQRDGVKVLEEVEG
jgi:hypothetical protein